MITAQTAAPQVRAESDRPQRTKRVPFGVPQTKLGVQLEVPGHHLYWCNDVAVSYTHLTLPTIYSV